MEERFDEVVLLDENGEEARFSHILTFLMKASAMLRWSRLKRTRSHP